MDPLTRTRLDIRRQEIVSSAIADALAADRPAPLLPGTRARAEAVVAIGRELRAFTNLTSKQIYNATRTIVAGIAAMLDRQERILCRSKVPRRAAQQQSLGRVHALQVALFPQGTGFTSWPMHLQWVELVKIRATLARPDVAAAIDAEGLSACVEDLLEHIALYGHAVGRCYTGAGAGRADAQEAWADAMQKLAAQVLIDYENDPETRDALLSPYEAHVEEQRAAARAKRAARRRKAEQGVQALEPQPPSPPPQPLLSPQPPPSPSPSPPRPPSPQASLPAAPRTSAASAQGVHAPAPPRYTDPRWPRHAPSSSRSPPPPRRSRRFPTRWARTAS